MDGKRITSDMLRAMVMRERRRSKQVSTVDWFVQAERDARANPAGIQIALAVDEQDSQIPYEALDEGGSATGVASLNSDGISSAPIIHSAPSSPSHGPISPLNTALHTPPSSTVYTSVDTPRTSSPLITSSPLLNASTRQRRSSTIVRSDKSADSWPVRARHRLRVIWHAAQAWIVTALVGVTIGTVYTAICLLEKNKNMLFFSFFLLIGITCATVDTWTSWLLTLRSGVCHSDSIFLETQLCCPFIGSSFIEEHCKSFRSWSSLVLPYYAPSDTDVAWVYTLVNILSFCLLAVLMAGLGSWLTVSIAPAAAGSGIPEVFYFDFSSKFIKSINRTKCFVVCLQVKTILSGVMMDSALRPLVSAVKAVALALVVGAGLSVGKEGPYIHLAACIGHWFCSLFSKYRHSEARKRELLSAACACGVSVAFGSPLGGVLFAMEDLCTYFPPKTMWRTFFCAIIGCVTLGYLDLKQAGTLFLFNVRYDRQWLWFELPAFAVVGVVCGVVGAALVAVNIKVAQFRRRHDWLNGHPIREVCLIALATAGIKYYFSELHEDAYELLNSLFLDCSDRT
jgi:H+/Cl- antiporter ClcA